MLRKAIASALMSAAGQTVFGGDRFVPRPKQRKYLVVLAHPDDETLIGGLIQRITKYTPNPKVIAFTNGNGNTHQNRISELRTSLTNLGYHGKLEHLMGENYITNLACIPQDNPKGQVSDFDILELSKRVGCGIDAIQEAMESTKADTILVPDYSGGHFVHDTTQMAAMIAARRIAKTRQIEVLEFPQYFISLNSAKEPNPDEIRTLAKKAQAGHRESLVELKEKMGYSAFHLGTFSPGSRPNFSDSVIGIQFGRINLTLPEITRKLISYLTYKNGTQSESFARLMGNVSQIADLSVEKLRKVPLEKDYTQKPSSGLCLYEFVTHRPFARFETFKKLYERIQEREK